LSSAEAAGSGRPASRQAPVAAADKGLPPSIASGTAAVARRLAADNWDHWRPWGAGEPPNRIAKIANTARQKPHRQNRQLASHRLPSECATPPTLARKKWLSGPVMVGRPPPAVRSWPHMVRM